MPFFRFCATRHGRSGQMLFTSLTLRLRATVSVTKSGQVKSVGRQAEKWRYRAEETVNARGHALKPDILMLDLGTRGRLPDCGSLHSTSGQQLLDEVPASWLNDGWTVAFAGKWDTLQNIMRLEGHGVVLSCKRILRSASSHGNITCCCVTTYPWSWRSGRAAGGALPRMRLVERSQL